MSSAFKPSTEPLNDTIRGISVCVHVKRQMPVTVNKQPVKVFLPLRVENDVVTIQTSVHLSASESSEMRKEIQGKPAGTSEGCIAVDVTLPTFSSPFPQWQKYYCVFSCGT